VFPSTLVLSAGRSNLAELGLINTALAIAFPRYYLCVDFDEGYWDARATVRMYVWALWKGMHMHVENTGFDSAGLSVNGFTRLQTVHKSYSAAAPGSGSVCVFKVRHHSETMNALNDMTQLYEPRRCLLRGTSIKSFLRTGEVMLRTPSKTIGDWCTLATLSTSFYTRIQQIPEIRSRQTM
jgi:hypothetical protein